MLLNWEKLEGNGTWLSQSNFFWYLCQIIINYKQISKIQKSKRFGNDNSHDEDLSSKGIEWNELKNVEKSKVAKIENTKIQRRALKIEIIVID